MSKLMMIAGLLLAAAGVALGLMVILSPGQLMAYGVPPDVAATLLVGGILALGLGGVIAAIEAGGVGHADHGHHHHHDEPAHTIAPAVTAAAATAGMADKAIETVAEAAKPTTADAVAALEKAKNEISDALGIPSIASMDKKPEPEPEPEPEAEEPATPEEEAEGGEDNLYVVEEKTIRGRPARILSDGTVEAETDEGWMRFENLEHLEEYLDAMEPTPKG